MILQLQNFFLEKTSSLNKYSDMFYVAKKNIYSVFTTNKIKIVSGIILASAYLYLNRPAKAPLTLLDKIRPFYPHLALINSVVSAIFLACFISKNRDLQKMIFEKNRCEYSLHRVKATLKYSQESVNSYRQLLLNKSNEINTLRAQIAELQEKLD